MTINEIKVKILPVLKKYNVKKAGIFGSAARKETKRKSDIDLLIEIENDELSLLDIIGLKIEIEEKIGKKIDIVEYDAIKSSIKDKILEEQVRIL